MTTYPARIAVTEYTVTAWPEDRDPEFNGNLFSIYVRPTHVKDRWAVIMRGGHAILTLGGNWTMQLPKQFRRRHYRSLDDALAAAAEAAPFVTVNGQTIADIIAFEDSRRSAS